jgi:hypothetical protein
MPSRVHETRTSGYGFPGSSFKYTPLRHVRVLILSFLQGLFAEAPTGNYRWSDDDELTELIIRDENPIRTDTLGQRPAISLTMGPIQFYSLGMDDMFSYDAAIDRKVKIVNIPGTLSLNCCSRVDLEAHDLAWVISEHIWLLRELLLKAGFFEIGRGIQINPPTPAGSIVTNDSGDEWFASTVNVPYQFTRKSAFTPLGERIAQNIETHMTVRPPQPVDYGRGGPAITGTEYPVHVNQQFPQSFAPGATDVYGKTPDPAGLRTYSLPLVPHPLNPAKLVTVTTVRPYRASAFRRLQLFP